ncbi:hypothetical protein PsalN5692_00715 [Piscirickettsia salmonis]|uniref:hypothetical protein n=1 Tax=Piscirickettsia salmonis TaxID=1238 RepID=UPI0012B936D1|nr:hypothetical protein [Piscirickettsia salmonis]QGP49292.1 hypothetical protein PsalN5692_00715 [Piscirickettsia salmonis]
MKLKKITLACGLSALVLSMSSFAGNFSGINYSSTSAADTSYTALVSVGIKSCKATASISQLSYTPATTDSPEVISFDINFSGLEDAETNSDGTHCYINAGTLDPSLSVDSSISPFNDKDTYHVETVTKGESDYSDSVYPITITDKTTGATVETKQPDMVPYIRYNPETNEILAVGPIYAAPISDSNYYSVSVEASSTAAN